VKITPALRVREGGREKKEAEKEEEGRGPKRRERSRERRGKGAGGKGSDKKLTCFPEFVVEELLNLEAFIKPREYHVEDLGYIGKMIVLFNAALSNPNILLLLPAFTKTHYRYMRDK
jgi:hypothetical protein